MEFTFLYCHFHLHKQLTAATSSSSSTTTTTRIRRWSLNLSLLFKNLFTRLPCTIINSSSPSPEPEREARTILALLRDQMDDVDSSRRRSSRMSFKDRLGLKGFGCCGPTWGFRPTTITDDDLDMDVEQEDMEAVMLNSGQEGPQERVSDPGCLDPNPSPSQQHSSGMNLAAALAAERQFREEAGNNMTEPNEVRNVGTTNVSLTSPGTPLRMSLMRLLEESTEGGGGGGEGAVSTEQAEAREEGVGSDGVCCVCMGRKKGSAFIPCGHTFCRVCSRELWLNRGSCPLCNRSILEILDIF